MKPSKSEVTKILPCSVVFLTAQGKRGRDAMTATAVFVSEDPALVTVSVAKHIVSHDLIEQAGEFVLSVASPAQTDLAVKLGSTHGGEVDKFGLYAIETEPAQRVAAPVIRGSYASLECKVITTLTAGTYTVYLAEVVAHKLDESLRPVVWQGNRFYAVD